MTRDMASIIDFVDQMEELDLSEVVPTIQIFPMENVFRKDIIQDSMKKELLLKNAPKQINGCFSVPKILES
jgi:aspartyl-tRNA(Asn)/glutamyl-tRNA(Gln) amidotransferase subunit C